MSNLGSATVEIKTKADTSELRQAIKDYKDGKISVEELRQATEKLKDSVKDQNQAIKAITMANRVNFYELNEGIRIMREANTVFRDMNSVMQTLTLKHIDNTQLTVQQQEAYDNLKTSLDDVVSALSVLGSSNTEVKQGFADILNRLSGFNSSQLTDTINELDLLKKTSQFTPDELQSLDEFENKLKQLRDETLKKEDSKNMQDFATEVNSVALTAASIGTFAATLAKIPAAITAINTAISASPYFIAFLAALELLRQGEDIGKSFGFQTAGGGENVDTSNVKSFNNSTQNNSPGGLGDFFGRLGPPQNNTTNLHMSIDNLTIAGETDIETFAKKVMDYINQQASLGAR